MSWRQVDSGSSVASQSSLLDEFPAMETSSQKTKGYFGIANLFFMH